MKIEAGTQVYCHQGGGIFSWSDGQLIIDGTADEPVVIQGDRLEAYYQDIPGQWEQILMMDGRAGADHRISHAIIRNGTIGLNCQSTLKVTECALRIDNTIIENQSAFGIFKPLNDSLLNDNLVDRLQCPDVYDKLYRFMQVYNNRMISNELKPSVNDFYEQAEDTIPCPKRTSASPL